MLNLPHLPFSKPLRHKILQCTHIAANLPTDKQLLDKVKSRSTRKLKDQCRTSCEDIILEAATPIQRGGSSSRIDFHGDEHDEQHRATAAAAMRSVLEDDSSSASVSSEALTTSAVDVLYHRRHEVSEGYDPSPQSESPRRLAEAAPRTDVDTSPSSSSSSSAMPSSSRAARPLYLPPLIETLVGAVDMDATQNDTKQDDDNGPPRQNLIRRPRDEKHSPRKSSLDSIIKGGDTTTKAVAAAAAATFWSSLQSRGRALVGRPSRMKNVNEEWDTALRWIAGWGKDELNADSAAVSTAKAKKADAFKRRSRIQSRKASKLGQSATKWDLVERLTAEEASELLILIEMCVDKCVEMTEDSEWNDQPKGRESSTPSASNSAVTDRNGSRSGQADVGSLPLSLFQLTLPHPFAVGILGLLLSATLAYFLHMGYDWTLPWQQKKEPSSEWISSKMEHDDRVAMPSSKSGGKKGKRRKRQAKPSVSSPETEKKPASSEREELSKTHTTQMSKSPSQKSLSDDDDANLVGLVRNTKRSSKSTSDNTPPRVPVRTKIRGSTDNVSNKHLGGPQCEPTSPQGSRRLKGKYRNSKSHQTKFPVPTEAQRQASHQQLREFQKMQLARLVQMKKDAKLAAERAASVRKKASVGVSYSSVASNSSSPTSPPRPAPETLAANMKGRNAKKDAKDAETETAFSSYATSPRSNIATPCQDLVQDHPLDDTAGELLLSSLSDVLDEDDQYQKRSFGESAVSPPPGFLSNATAAPANTEDHIQSLGNVDGSSLDARTIVRSTPATWSSQSYQSGLAGSHSGIW